MRMKALREAICSKRHAMLRPAGTLLCAGPHLRAPVQVSHGAQVARVRKEQLGPRPKVRRARQRLAAPRLPQQHAALQVGGREHRPGVGAGGGGGAGGSGGVRAPSELQGTGCGCACGAEEGARMG